MTKKSSASKNKSQQQSKTTTPAKEQAKQPVVAAAKPVETVQAPAAVVEEVYVPQPISLSRKGPKTIGKPKSGKSWNVGSQRSAKQTKYNPKTWEQKVEDRKKLKALKERIAESKIQKINERKSRAQKLKEKLKRKEINQARSSTYQIIKDTTKIRKWSKKAKMMLSTLPAEVFYERFK
eukprot:403335864